MQIQKINPNLIISRPISQAEIVSQAPKGFESPDALTKELSFMGLRNTGIVKLQNEVIHSNISPTLNKYFEKLNHFERPDATILYKKNNEIDLELIILKTPDLFNNALETLRKNIKHPPKNIASKLSLHDEFFDNYIQISKKVPALQKTYIKGIAGQGMSSTAFLTNNDEILKLSFCPLFPSEKNFAHGVEIPIIDRYKVKLDDGTMVYGMKEKFAEVGSIRNMSIDEYNNVWDQLNYNLKQVNPKYTFCDFKRNNLNYRMQLGFVEDVPYLLDHECIDRRHLVT
jgi:hypothetical protein